MSMECRALFKSLANTNLVPATEVKYTNQLELDSSEFQMTRMQ